jgi:hypothetical protein
MKKTLLFLTIVILTACQDKKTISPASDIVGKWRLVSYCQPSGGVASGCIPKVIPDNKAVYIEFSSKGEFNETYKNTIPADYAFLGCGGGSYNIEDNNVRIKALCMSSSNGKVVEITSLSSKKLTLKTYIVGEYVFERE